MSGNSRWKVGTPIVFRGVWLQRIWFACPAIIVEDKPDLIAFYWRAGTRVKKPHKRTTPQDMLSSAAPFILVDKTWTNTDVLLLTIPGAAHSIFVMWDEGHTRFRCWYINLQEPLQRTPIGFDTMDHLLDIIVHPDRSNWQWKDEDEFEEAIFIGVFSPEKADEIRAEGKRALKLILDNEACYCEHWKSWRPPSDWKIPELPSGWGHLQ